MQITIDIPDEEIKECLKAKIVSEIMSENSFGYGERFRKEYKEIIKELIYQPEVKPHTTKVACFPSPARAGIVPLGDGNSVSTDTA